jgi:protein tyrosine/serine phosphatase
VRDLGGYPTEDGRRLRWGALIRSDNLGHLTVAGRAALLDSPVRTIIDLRRADESAMFPHVFQEPTARRGRLTYLNVPLIDQTGADLLGEIESPLAMYQLIVNRYRRNLADIMRTLAHAAPGGVLIHCHAGKDRTGLVAAFVLAVVGVSPTLIAEDYAVSDWYLQPLYADWLAQVAHDPIQHARLAQQLTTPPEVMRDLLRDLDRQYGGVAGYLRSASVSDREMEAIRHRLCEKPGRRDAPTTDAAGGS